MPRRMGRPGLMGTMARTAVIAGTATAVSGSVSRRGQQRAAAQQQSAAEQQQAMTDQAAAQAAAQLQAQQAQAPQVAAPAAPSTDDKIARIKELGELKTAGLLTDEEFAAEKAKVLASELSCPGRSLTWLMGGVRRARCGRGGGCARAAGRGAGPGSGPRPAPGFAGGCGAVWTNVRPTRPPPPSGRPDTGPTPRVGHEDLRRS